jgi:hypothetical protein
MSLIIIAFKTAPLPNPEWKAKDEALDNEIRKKTTGKNFVFLLKIVFTKLISFDRNL